MKTENMYIIFRTSFGLIYYEGCGVKVSDCIENLKELTNFSSLILKKDVKHLCYTQPAGEGKELWHIIHSKKYNEFHDCYQDKRKQEGTVADRRN